MKNFIVSFCLFVFVSFSAFAQNAKWITAPDAGVNSPNTCQKLIEEIPSQYYPYIVLHQYFFNQFLA